MLSASSGRSWRGVRVRNLAKIGSLRALILQEIRSGAARDAVCGRAGGQLDAGHGGLHCLGERRVEAHRGRETRAVDAHSHGHQLRPVAPRALRPPHERLGVVGLRRVVVRAVADGAHDDADALLLLRGERVPGVGEPLDDPLGGAVQEGAAPAGLVAVVATELGDRGERDVDAVVVRERDDACRVVLGCVAAQLVQVAVDGQFGRVAVLFHRAGGVDGEDGHGDEPGGELGEEGGKIEPKCSGQGNSVRTERLVREKYQRIEKKSMILAKITCRTRCGTLPLSMQSRGKTVAEYLRNCSPKERGALQSVRAAILATSPKIEEYFSYGMPMYKYLGHVAAIGVFKKHCSLFIMNRAYFTMFAKELKGFKCIGTTIHFTPDHPVPASVVKKILKQRIRDNEAKQKVREALKTKKTK